MFCSNNNLLYYVFLLVLYNMTHQDSKFGLIFVWKFWFHRCSGVLIDCLTMFSWVNWWLFSNNLSFALR